MDGRQRPSPAARYVGREEMQALALATVGALERAGLTDVLQDLNRRLFDRSPEEFCETTPTGDDTWQLNYKPIIELLLYEVKDVARMPHLTDEQRRERIAWAMLMAGI